MTRTLLIPLAAALLRTACSAILTSAATTDPVTAEVNFTELPA
jgi:hypothetical protein